jgi:hypothetical protein
MQVRVRVRDREAKFRFERASYDSASRGLGTLKA